jgi:hypothetical protein
VKAWYLEVKDSDEGRYLVFANTRNAARSQADSNDLMYDRWIDIVATRAPKYDGLEKLTKRELDKTIWRDGWTWLDYDAPDEAEATDEEFYAWYDGIFGVKL